MTIHLTPEQERRIQAVIGRGSYESVDQVVEAALVAVEQRSAPGFDGTEEELETLLTEGLASEELTESEFWDSVNMQTDAMLAEHQSGKVS
jgi:Arc/MetJ-type ribon-helix-helix transcriptional regulator